MKPWPWKRRGITPLEAAQSKEHLAEVRAREPEVARAIANRRARRNRNGFAALIDEGLTGGHRP